MNLTEKQRFGLLTAAVVGGFVLLAAVVFYPMATQLFATRSEITRMEGELAARNFSGGEIPLRSQAAQEKRLEEIVQSHWQRARARLSKFSEYHSQIADADRVAYISEIAAQRGRLHGVATSTRLQIPLDLGMPDSVTTNDDPAVLMMQLRVIEAIIGIAREQRVHGRITAIEPLPPVTHNISNTNTPYYKQFPVRIELETELEPLLRMIYSASAPPLNENEPRELLAVSGLRIEKRVPEGNNQVNESNPRLRATVVFDALVMLKEAETAAPAATPAAPSRPRNLEPMGY
jgi:hypothetical protein